MVMVIVAIVILSTIGLAILSLSLDNYRLSLFDRTSNLSFYMAESGLEQAYEIIFSTVKQAVEMGKISVNNTIEVWIEKEKQRTQTGGGTGGYNPTYNSPFLDTYGNPYYDKIYEELGKPGFVLRKDCENAFKLAFRKFINDHLKNYLNDASNYRAISNISSDPPKITIEKINNGDPGRKPFEDLDDGDSCLITLSSVYDKEDDEGKKTPQKVVMSFEITVPTYLPSAAATSVSIGEVHENPIWNYALVSSENNIAFIHDGLKAEIIGDVYCRGYNPKATLVKAYSSQPYRPFDVDIQPTEDEFVTVEGLTLAKTARNTNGINVTIDGNVSCLNNIQHQGNILGPMVDTDGDGIRDWLDNDHDNDGIEGWDDDDFDNDGEPDSTDDDDDNDGILDKDDPYLGEIPVGVSTHSKLTIKKNVYTHNVVINNLCEEDEIKIEGNVYTSGHLILYGTSSINIDTWYKMPASTELIQSDVNTKGGHISVANTVELDLSRDAHRKIFNELKFKQIEFADLRLYVHSSFFGNANNDAAHTFGDYFHGQYGPGGEGSTRNNPAKEVFWVNSDESKLFVIEKGYSFDPANLPPATKVLYVDSPCKGVILNREHVKFFGNITFTGLVIAQHCISFASPSNFKFIADPNYVKQAVIDREEKGLLNPFHYDPQAGKLSYPELSNFWTEKKLVWEDSSKAVVSTSSFETGDLIKIRDWEKAK